MPQPVGDLVLDRVEALLDQRVRPLLRSHGGAISVVGFDQGVLSVRLRGECAGCPAADLSMRYLVRDELLSAVAEVRQVALEGGVSDELIDQARALLHLAPRPGRTTCPTAPTPVPLTGLAA
ncbi:MAG: NifU family protein [Propionibacteriaceae bacterium]|jgi:Fe-S cluster biogenesis protein NfuA|nr:NifU family protein [Propionibacteriaceae bacterium]